MASRGGPEPPGSARRCRPPIPAGREVTAVRRGALQVTSFGEKLTIFLCADNLKDDPAEAADAVGPNPAIKHGRGSVSLSPTRGGGQGRSFHPAPPPPPAKGVSSSVFGNKDLFRKRQSLQRNITTVATPAAALEDRGVQVRRAVLVLHSSLMPSMVITNAVITEALGHVGVQLCRAAIAHTVITDTVDGHRR